MTYRLLPHLSLLIVAIIYGLNFVIAKNVMTDGFLTPFQFILLRVGVGTILFWIFFLIFIKERIEKKDIPYMIMCAFFGTAVNQLSFFAGLNYTTPIHASLLMTLVPIIVLVVSGVLLNEKITLRKISGIILGICGALYLILAGKNLAINNDLILGDLLVMVNVTSYSLYLVLVKKLVTKYHPITVVTWLFTFGLFMVIPFGIDGIEKVAWASFPGNAWISIAYVIIGTTFIAYWLNAYAISRVYPSTVSIYIYLQPFVASLAAVVINSETLGPEKVISGILIFIGVYFVSFSKKSTEKSRIF